MSSKFFIKTYGCQLNEADSEKMTALLCNIGYEKTGDIFDANLILLNTCCIRNTAEQKVYGKIGDLKKLKENNRNLLLGICGCVASKEKENLIKRFPWVDFVVDTFSIENLPKIITELMSLRVQKFKESENYQLPITDYDTQITESKSQVKANVMIINGCNYACSFCIVPKVRGREKSRSIEEVVCEVSSLVEKGVREITLVGQNILAYGRDLNKRNYFIELLDEIHKIPELKRIRFVTSHPKDFSDEIIEGISRLSKVCEYFHLPIQSGEDEILKKMNRNYTVEYYKKRVEKLRTVFPNCAISTDIIVGFPSETEEQFENTLRLVKEIEFDNVYTFMYSTRSGTRAEKFDGQLPPLIKKRRLHKLQEIQNEITLKKNDSLVGNNLEVLVEGYDKKNKNKLVGRTKTNKLVLFEGKKDLIGKEVYIKINTAKTWTLYGDVIMPM